MNLNKSIVVTCLKNVGRGFQNFGEEILQHNEKARCNIVEYTTAFQYWTDPGLNYNRGFLFLCSKRIFSVNFLYYFKGIQSINCRLQELR